MSLKDYFQDRGLYIGHLNIRSLFPKIDILQHMCTEIDNTIDVLGISESWLQPQLPDDMVGLFDYNLIRNDRNWNRNPGTNQPQKGGGVCLYLKCGIEFNSETFKHFNRSTKDLEIQWVHLPNKFSKDIIIINGYRPPSGDVLSFLEILENTLSTIDLSKFDIFLMGDFNIDLNDRLNGNSKLFTTKMKTLGCTQLIKTATRFSQTRNSKIDLIFSNCDYIASANAIAVNISDHDMIICCKKRICIKRKKVDFYGRSYRNYNMVDFQLLLENSDWREFDDGTDTEYLWNIFLDNIRSSIDHLCPIKKFSIKPVTNPWLTNELLEEIKDKDAALRKARRTKRDDHWAEARHLRNSCLKNIRNAKSEFVKEQISENRHDSKKFWNSINKLLPGNTKSKQDITLTDENQVSIKKDITANYMNEYFATIGTKLAQTFPAITIPVKTNFGNYLENFVTNNEEMVKLIKEINVSKSSAINNLSSKILKDAFIFLSDKLTKIINLSLAQGIVPSSWKHAVVIPLHKGGSDKEVNNFRPVSLLPIQGKLIEKIVHKRIVEWLDQNNILDSRQGGFRKGHSTTDTTVNFVNDLYSAINDEKVTIAVYIDLRKAFDTVNHQILCRKMENYGIIDQNLTWIRSYLSDRTQSVFVNGTTSNEEPISCGVPQGSVLGPLLFLIYVNNMKNSLSVSSYHLYADDTVIYYSGNQIADIVPFLQSDLNSYYNWCNINCLTLNVKKTKFVMYGTRSRVKKMKNVVLNLGGNQIFCEPSYNYLGIVLDSSLSFKKHMDQCAKVVSHKIFILSKIRKSVSEETAIFVYRSMIAPIIDYGDVVYSGGLQEGIAKLQKLQNRALRICLDVHHYLPTVLLHQEAEVVNLKIRRSCNVKKYMYKQQTNEDLLVKPKIQTRRHKGIIFNTYKPNLEICKKNPLYRGALIWNALDPGVRNIPTFDKFKLYLKDWAINMNMNIQLG